MPLDLDPSLRARLLADDASAWGDLCAWIEASPATRAEPQALAGIETLLAAWPPDNRAAAAEDWGDISAGGEPPAWWPLVRTVTVDEFAGLAPSSALAGVQVLRFGQRAGGVDLAALAALPDLRELDLGGVGADLAALPLAPALERLSVAADALPEDFARRVPGLKSLSLARSARLAVLPALPAGLERLDLTGCAALASIEPAAACPALRVLNLLGCDALAGLEAIATLPAIAQVWLDARRPRALAPLAGRPSLRDLYVAGGPAVMDLRALDHHAGLRGLQLEGCEQLEGLAGLTLPALEQLYVLRCAVTGLPDLTASPRLKVLNLEGLPTLSRLPALAPGRALDLLSLADLPGLPADAPRPSARRTVVDGAIQ